MIRSFFKSFTGSFSLFSKKQKKNVTWLFLLMLLSLFIDLLSLASLIPLLFSFIDSEPTSDTEYLRYLLTISPFENDRLATLRFFIALVFILFVAKTTFSHYVIKFQSAFIFGLAQTLACSSFQHMITDQEFDYSKQTRGEVLNEVMHIPDQFAQKIIKSYLDIGVNLVLAGIILSFLILYETKIFFYLGALLFPAVILYYIRLNKSLNKTKVHIKTAYPLFIQKVVEGAVGKLDIIFSGSMKFFSQQVNNVSAKYFEALSKHIIISSLSPRFIELIAVSGICFLFLSFTFGAGVKIIAILSIYTIAAYRLIPSLSHIATSLTNIKVHSFTIEKIRKRIVPSQALENTETSKKPLEFHESIKLKKESFHYPGSDFTLKNLMLEIKINDKVALVGKSGMGKSTLAKLIIGTIRPKKESLFVDEKEINAYNLKAWQHNIAYVPQDPFIFKGSLYDNITMGDERNATNQQKVRELLNLLELTEMTINHEGGIFMDLGENGENISGGQKQRVAIARALYLEKPVIFFDEVTSNLDEINRKKVINNILKIIQMNKTVIFITHQEEIINACNVVINMENYQQ